MSVTSFITPEFAVKKFDYNITISTWNLLFYKTETQCEPPTPTTGSVYSCSGGNVDYLGTCDLTCTSGYVGARQLTCDQHTTNAALSTYDTPSACTSKYLW